jgi:hypothetical protein
VNGTAATREALQAGSKAADLVARWKKGEDQFRQERAIFLLY